MVEPEAQVLIPSYPQEFMGNQDMTKLFFITTLDNAEQRTAVLEKVQEYLTGEKEKFPYKVIYLGQSGWKCVGQVTSLTYYVMSLCRRHNLLPSERSILLSLHDQYQVIQLCLAKINKNKHGEFMAAASDVLDVWNEMYRNILTSDHETLSENCVDLGLPCSDKKSYDPLAREMKEIIQDYQEFLVNSSCVDHFSIYSCVSKNLKQNQDLQKDILSKAYIIEGVNQMPTMERELLKLIFTGSHVFKLSAEFPLTLDASAISYDLNVSGIVENDDLLSPAKDKPNETHKHVSEEITVVKVDNINSNLADYINDIPKSPCKAYINTESELYVEQIILAHLRLLVNTRDELALTVTCSMPGREITQQGFTDIRLEAKKKNMPMYQTILSFIMRQRLGGKGYQADPKNPVLLHVKPLGEFVDSVMKLQNIVEEEPNPRKGAIHVLSALKTNLLRMRGCVLKRATVEKVWTYLNVALSCIMNLATDAGELEAQPPLQQSSLQPCLKYLIHLCDEASGHVYDVGIVDALGENFLTQCSSAHKFTTPLKIPTVLSLFRSPGELESKEFGASDKDDEDLQARVLKKMGFSTNTAAEPKKYYSGCAWAPSDLSPVNMGAGSPTSASPITGPSLKVLGKRKTINDWKNIVEFLSQGEDLNEEKVADTAPDKSTKESQGGQKGGERTKKRSKRSLLSDISNVADQSRCKKKKSPVKNTKPNNAEQSGCKKQKCPVKNIKEKAVTRKKIDLPRGQIPITSFFKV
ncbi:uncharacterized protein [Panulirus ornatus]|uniref:uncharacterized protein n=1 Tax=Panulirus ornatus TaxID=150431 RepID=UPI003A885002